MLYLDFYNLYKQGVFSISCLLCVNVKSHSRLPNCADECLSSLQDLAGANSLFLAKF